jgi:predicted DNA-binding transcriptional regulator AlpA
VNSDRNSRSGVPPLLTQAEFRQLLGGMSERKFQQLRADGIVPAPLELGPRVARWTSSDVAEAIAKLPRRAAKEEPETLAEARRRRINAMKTAPAAPGA